MVSVILEMKLYFFLSQSFQLKFYAIYVHLSSLTSLVPPISEVNLAMFASAHVCTYQSLPVTLHQG